MISTTYLTEIIVKAVPYPNQIEEWEHQEDGVVRFTWRHDRYRVDGLNDKIFVETCHNGILSGGNKSILMEALLTRQWLSMDLARPRQRGESGRSREDDR